MNERTGTDANFKNKDRQIRESDKLRAERAAAEKASDLKRVALKSLGLAREAQKEPSMPKKRPPK